MDKLPLRTPQRKENQEKAWENATALDVIQEENSKSESIIDSAVQTRRELFADLRRDTKEADEMTSRNIKD